MSAVLMPPRVPTPAQRARWGLPAPGAPPWLAAAWGELDERELTGRENSRIVAYHATTSLRAREDEIPWCSSFVNWCVRVSGLPGTNDARAISWRGPSPVLRTLTAPRYGCITVVRHRGAATGATGSASGNHVGLWLRQDRDTVTLCGGNQNDSVNLSNFALGGAGRGFDVLAWAWPRDFPLPAPAAQRAA